MEPSNFELYRLIRQVARHCIHFGVGFQFDPKTKYVFFHVKFLIDNGYLLVDTESPGCVFEDIFGYPEHLPRVIGVTEKGFKFMADYRWKWLHFVVKFFIAAAAVLTALTAAITLYKHWHESQPDHIEKPIHKTPDPVFTPAVRNGWNNTDTIVPHLPNAHHPVDHAPNTHLGENPISPVIGDPSVNQAIIQEFLRRDRKQEDTLKRLSRP